MRRLLSATFMAFFILFASNAIAGLILRGDGLVYDSDQNLTWLRDASLAGSETFGVPNIRLSTLEYGTMSWVTAQEWISAMNAANYLGYSDWRLPKTKPVNGIYFNTNFSFDGTTDVGYNNIASELGYMFYVNLGNKGWYDTLGNPTGCETTVPFCLTNAGPFENLIPAPYWIDPTDFSSEFWTFRTDGGHQVSGLTDRFHPLYVWAVRDGDSVQAVPEPSTLTLIGLGLTGLCLTACRRKSADDF